jgi:GH15 family glucan-1,4-alpha-glucosidase
MCFPRWDSPSIFTALIGGTGGYSIAPEGRFVWGGYYEPASLVWRHRWVTETGVVECRDALAFPGDAQRAVLLRRVHAVDHSVTLQLNLQPRGDYDQTRMTDLHRHGDIWTARVGATYLRWSGAGDARPRLNGERLALRFELAGGEERRFGLEISEHPLPTEPLDAEQAWRVTEEGWRDQVPALDGGLTPPDARQSYAVLRGLTSRGGGTVAAATTSLPEHAESGRNYDYRYVWIRDQCYLGEAIAACGPHPLLDDSLAFVTARVLDRGDHLAPAYTATGRPVPRQRRLNLPGYPGGDDIVGNKVGKQFQLDAFGETLLLLACAAQYDRLEPDHWKAAEIAADAIARRWTGPDAGIWELDRRAWTHSRLTASAGLRAIARVRPGSPQASEWLTLADGIIADTSAHALHPDGRWQRAADDPAVDAALLLPPLRGAVPADDPRTVATLLACLDELTQDGFAYRFRHDSRPLADAEGSFLLCGFVTALALDQRDEQIEARGWYERTRAACGPPQLFSEEYDVQQHQMRGNLGQAFVHALMLECSARLAR